jgi:hypothetical protein
MKSFLDAQMKYPPSIVKVRQASRAANRLVTWATIAIVGVLANIAYAVPSFAQIVGTAQLNVERRGHTATLLEDGKVLIVGGDNQNGMVSQAELLDPVSQTSSLAATSIVARTDHTATRLADARVLVIGGRDQNGSLTSTEIYDPMTGTFTAGPSLTTPRSGHTSTVLSDGKILIAGGDVSGSAEIYDPATQSFSLIAANMTAARKFHSAILTNAGQLLIVGGVDAQNTVLNTAEVYDASSQSFYMPPTDMQAPRALASLKLLADGKIQIIGGDAELSMEVLDPVTGIFNAKALLPPNANLLAATLSTQSRAALFSPLVLQDPMLQGLLTPEQSALLDRADQSITELPSHNQALVAGGINSAGEILKSAMLVKSSSASVTTDKTDYAPGQIVTISGSGFQPNEPVQLSLHEFPEEYADIFFSAIANAQGNFVAAEFAPQVIDLGRTFTLTGIGQSSGFTAQTAFTDATNETTTTTVSCSPGTVAVNTATTCTAHVTNTQSGAVNGYPQGNVNFSAVSGLSGTFSPSTCTLVQIGSTLSSTCSVSFTPTVLQNGTVRGQYARSSNLWQNSTIGTFDLTVTAVAPTNLTVQPADGTYGGTTTLSATLKKTSDSSPINGKTISFTVNGVSAGSATTNGSGVATLSGVSLSGINAGTYPTGVGASFAGDSGFQASSGTNTLTVNKKDATWTTNPASKTYGDADPTPLTTGSGSGFLPADGVSATYSRTSGENASPPTYHITATLSATVAGALNNYNITNNGAEFTINQRAITVTADAKTKIYGQSDPPLTYQVTSGSLAFSDAFTGALSRVDGELVGTYAIQQGTLALNSNYMLTYIGDNLTITTAFLFNGFYSPIGGSVENYTGGSFADPLRAFKLGSTIPVKFGATWLNGGAPLITGIHTLQAIKYTSTTDSDSPIDATPTDAATTGNQFRLTSPDWHFNLSTKSGFSVGTWLLVATLQDGSKHSVWISIKK